jgi:dnd system-associated protein 4
MKRVNQAEDKDSIIEALTSGERPIFSTKWSLFMFAAILGFKHGSRCKLTKTDQGKAIRTEQFANNDMCFNGVLNLMTLLEKEDERLLVSNEENDDLKVTIFEEYVNGGLSLLKEKLETSSFSLDSIIAFVAEEIFEKNINPEDIVLRI